MSVERCRVCNFPFVYSGSDRYRTCSQFCVDMTTREALAFVNAQPGDYCMYPCLQCGEITEGEYHPSDPKMSLCGECMSDLRRRATSQRLRPMVPLSDFFKDSD